MNRCTLVNGLGLQPRAAIASSWFTAELRRVHGPHLIPMSARDRTYKQLQRTVMDRVPRHVGITPPLNRGRIDSLASILAVLGRRAGDRSKRLASSHR